MKRRLVDGNELEVSSDDEFDYQWLEDRDGDYEWEHDGQPFSGVAFVRDPGTGRLDILEGYERGVRHGVCRRWYRSGRPKSEIWFDRRRNHGPDRGWYESGQAKHEIDWEYGVVVRRRRFDPGGAVLEDYEMPADGPSRDNLDCRRARSRRPFIDLDLETFDFVERDSAITCASLGLPPNAAAIAFEHLLWTGVFTAHDPDTKVLVELVGYEQSVRHGPRRRWYPSGKRMSEHYYSLGVRHGRWRDWYENGQIKLDAHYDSNVLLHEREWLEDGRWTWDRRCPSAEPSPAQRRSEIIDIDPQTREFIVRSPGWGRRDDKLAGPSPATWVIEESDAAPNSLASVAGQFCRQSHFNLLVVESDTHELHRVRQSVVQLVSHASNCLIVCAPGTYESADAFVDGMIADVERQLLAAGLTFMAGHQSQIAEPGSRLRALLEALDETLPAGEGYGVIVSLVPTAVSSEPDFAELVVGLLPSSARPPLPARVRVIAWADRGGPGLFVDTERSALERVLRWRSDEGRVRAQLEPRATIIVHEPPRWAPLDAAAAGDTLAVSLARGLVPHPRPLAPRSVRRINGTRADSAVRVYQITGEVYDDFCDFKSGASFVWNRRYSSAWADSDGPLGFGWRHRYQCRLMVRLDRAVFIDWDGEAFEFPDFGRLANDWRVRDTFLVRCGANRYEVHIMGQGSCVFETDGLIGEVPMLEFRPARASERLLFCYAGLRLIECKELAKNSEILARYRFEYDDHGHLIALVEQKLDEPGETERICMGYSECGDLVEVRNAVAAVWSYVYDQAHRWTQRVDPRGHGYRYAYDDQGRCIRVDGDEGHRAGVFEYFPTERITRFTYADGVAWGLHYDPRGLLLREIQPNGGVICREYGEDDRLLRTLDVGGRVINWHYNNDGVATHRTDRFGHRFGLDSFTDPFRKHRPRTAFERLYAPSYRFSPNVSDWLVPELLDHLPEPIHELARAFLGVRAAERRPVRPTEYDGLGNVVRGPDGEYCYDACGELIERIDPSGRVHRWTYHAFGREHERIDPLGRVTRSSWGIRDDQMSLIDPLGNETRWEYDALDRVVQVWRHGRVRDNYIYDEHDHFVEKRDGLGALVFRNVEFGANHFVVLRTLESGGVHRFDYNEHGRTICASTEAHEVRLSFDDSGGRAFDLHDGLGIEHRTEPPLRRSVVLERFELSQSGDPATFVRGPAGDRIQIARLRVNTITRECSNDTVVWQQFDAAQRMRGQLVFRPSPGPAWAVGYEYSDVGELLAAQDSSRGTTRYRYDGAGRLVEAQLNDRPKRRYVYDDADNLIEVPEIGRIEIGPGNLIYATKTEQFHHDSRDRISVREGPGSVTRYEYDSFDMLRRVSQHDPDGRSLLDWSAEYDAVGRRLIKQNDGRRDEFYWDDDRLAARIDPTGGLRIYHYASAAGLVPIAFTDYVNRHADPSVGRVYQVFADPTGSPLHIEDADGRGVWTARHTDPYGWVDVDAGATIEYNLRRAGHYFDAELGLNYNRYRYFDPRLGRYLSPHPNGHQHGASNLYAGPTDPLAEVSVLGL